MLERTAWTGVPAARDEPERREAPDTVSAASIVAFLKRHARSLLLATAVGVGLAAAYAFTATPHFTAETRIVIDPALQHNIRERTLESSFTLDNAQVESQIAVLRSEKIASTVIAALDLTNDPDFQPKDGRLIQLLRLVWTLPPPPPPTDLERARHVMGVFQYGLNVRRVGLSYAIDVSFRSPDPQRAAQIANATVEAYIREQLQAKSDAARLGSEWLEQRSAQLRTQMTAAAHAVQEFRARHDYRLPQATERDGDTRDSARRARYSLEELETTAQTYRRIYESFLQSLTESVQRQSYPVPDARVVTQASPPLEPSDPRVKLVLALGGVVGALAGFGLALARHNLDLRIRAPAQLRDEVGVECLGTLPRISRRDPGRSRRIARRLGSELARPTLPKRRRVGSLEEVVSAPHAPFSAALMTLRTRIGLGIGRAPVRSIGVVSAAEGEGKSTVASNLALLCALSGQRTLLIDADLRGSRLSRAAVPGITTGLVQALDGSLPLAEAIVADVCPNLDVLPSGGPFAPIAHESLLGSEAMQALIDTVTQEYDVVVVDSAALDRSMGALAVGGFLEAVVLVTEWGKTSTTAAAEGAHWLQAVQARLLGAVITKAEG